MIRQTEVRWRLILGLLLVLVPTLLGASWPQYRHDAGQRAAVRIESELRPGNVQGVRIDWRSPINGSAPIQYAGKLYTLSTVPAPNDPGETRAAISALDPQDGGVLWQRRLPCTVPWTMNEIWPAAGDGILVVPTAGCGAKDIVGTDTVTNGTLWALDAGTGRTLWKHRPARDRIGVPVIANGAVYLPYRGPVVDFSRSYRVAALDLTAGTVLWDRKLPDEVSGIFTWASADAEHVVIVNEDFGSGALWQDMLFTAGDWISLDPNDGSKVARDRCDVLYGVCAFDVRNGSTLWVSSDLIQHPPAIVNGVAFGVCACAVDAWNGRLIWRTQFPPGTSPLGDFDDWQDMNPVVAGKVVYVGVEDSDEDHVLGYDRFTGELVADLPISGPFIVVDGTIYARGPTAWRL